MFSISFEIRESASVEEVNKILKRISEQIESGIQAAAIWDANGNKLGSWSFDDEES
jgi:hypothetical protein